MTNVVDSCTFEEMSNYKSNYSLNVTGYSVSEVMAGWGNRPPKNSNNNVPFYLLSTLYEK